MRQTLRVKPCLKAKLAHQQLVFGDGAQMSQRLRTRRSAVDVLDVLDVLDSFGRCVLPYVLALIFHGPIIANAGAFEVGLSLQRGGIARIVRI